MSENEKAPEPTAETWTFGGTRVTGGKKVHAWVMPDGAELLFKASGSYAVGSEYRADVVRTGERVTLYGKPTYTGRSGDADLITHLSVRHRAAEASLAAKARERKDKQDDPLEAAIDRVRELLMDAPMNQRRDLTAYVIARMTR